MNIKSNSAIAGRSSCRIFKNRQEILGPLAVFGRGVVGDYSLTERFCLRIVAHFPIQKRHFPHDCGMTVLNAIVVKRLPVVFEGFGNVPLGFITTGDPLVGLPVYKIDRTLVGRGNIEPLQGVIVTAEPQVNTAQ